MSSEKKNLEIGALTQFELAQSSLLGPGRFAFQELREPPEPDGLCSLDGRPLFVEVGHIYGTQSDIKQFLGRTGNSAPSGEQKIRSNLVPLDSRILTPLNSLLAHKGTKTYSAVRIWLLIRSASPFWRLEDFKEHQDRINVPEVNPFEQIWILCGPRASDGVFRLA